MKVKIIFGSESGNTKYMSELLSKRFTDLQHEVDVFQVGVSGFEPDIEGYDIVLFGAPTYYGGQLQLDMAKFATQCKPDLSKVKVAVFGLGDSGYRDFCKSAEILEAWVKACQGRIVVPSLKIDGYPKNFDEITTWVKSILQAAQQ